jgi:photosystem II stability/assembly factor-like uncharacterized protein
MRRGVKAPGKVRSLAASALLGLAVLQAATAAPPRVLLLDGAVVGSDLIAVGELGTILRSSASGGDWQRVTVPTTATLTGVSFAPDGRHGWAVGHDALVLATSDGGSSWNRQFQGDNLQDSFLDVLALDARQVIAIGAYGLCLVTRDGGATWSRQKLIEEDNHLNRLTRGPDGTLYLAGEHGTLLRSADAGAHWTRLAAPYDGSFYGILPVDAHTLLAYGLRGRVFRSIDDGATWRPIATPQPVLLATSLRLSATEILLAGQARTLLVSHDGGVTFAGVPALETAIAELLPAANGTIIALGEAGATVLPKPQ